MPHSAYKTFVSIVDTGSLAATARKLHLSPSAVSKQLSTLEQRLGTKLIQRSTRSIHVTEAGERFFQRCIAILQATEAAEAEIKDLAGAPSGPLRITLPQVMATQDFAQMLRQFTQSYPAVSVELVVSNDTENLINKNLDVGFRVGPLEDSQLIASELFQTEVMMCASPQYIEKHGFPTTVDKMIEHTLLMPSYLNLSPYFKPTAKSENTSPLDNHILCDNANMLLELAIAGAGLAMIMETSLRTAIKNKELITKALPVKRAPIPVNLIYLSRDYIPSRVSLFVEHVKKYYQ